MLSRAVEFHKLYILCLLSLGLIQTSIPEGLKVTIEEFDRDVLPSLEIHIPIKSPGSAKVLKKPGIFNQYWEDSVVSRIYESIKVMNEMNPSRRNCSLVNLVFSFYKENMHHGNFFLDEFPRILEPEKGAAKKVPRPPKRKKEPETPTEPENEPIEIVEEMEVVELEEDFRPLKRVRRREALIEASIDQVVNVSERIIFVGSICLMECFVSIF